MGKRLYMEQNGPPTGVVPEQAAASVIDNSENKRQPNEGKAAQLGRNRQRGVFKRFAAATMITGATLTGAAAAHPDTAPGRLEGAALVAPAAPDAATEQ